MAGDPRFYARTGPHDIAAVARAAGAADVAAGRALRGVAPLQTAGPDEVSFLDNARYLPMLRETRAGAVLVRADAAASVPEATTAIVVGDPYLAWARVAALFHPEPPAAPGIHPTALVDPAAQLGPDVEIGPGVVIGPGAEIGARVRIGAGAVIGQGVVIGEGGRIGAQVAISHALLGARVRVLPGARIGQEGFGFATGPQGFVAVPQLGRVIIGDDCDIGANTTIDRGSSQDTVIGAGSRLDNLVQIGHNVVLGRCCVIVAQVGISGSTVLGDFVMIGGQGGLAGHLRIGDRARIAAQAGVMADVPAGAEMFGSPARPIKEAFRAIVWLHRRARESRHGKRSSE